eukprot:scaffold2848_cov150-Skeletonema_menzelii.AAC.51
MASLNRLALRSLPTLAAAQQSLSTGAAAFSVGSFSRSSTHPLFIPSHISAHRQFNNHSVMRTYATTPSPQTPSGSDILASYSSDSHIGQNVAHAMEMLAKADAVCFDVDSTVIDEEGIDVLADTLGKGPEVTAWTTKAMNGNIKFEDALAARLAIIKPSKTDIANCLEKHPLRLSPGVDRLVEALHKRGTDVYLVSGGFRLMIEPVANVLGVSHDRIYANTITFDENGDYTGFDSNEPTSADQGKPKALTMIKEKYGYKTMVMVGDGATDAQAKPPADAFVGFGGVVARAAVKEKACWFVHDFETMIDIVNKNSK